MELPGRPTTSREKDTIRSMSAPTHTSDRAASPLRVELALALLRMAIGWHFLYEGWVKLL